MASESEQLQKQTEEQRVCALVATMSSEQLGRCLQDEVNGPMVFMHTTQCDSPVCKKIFAESKVRVGRGEVWLSLHRQWRKRTLAREAEYLAAKCR